MGKQWKTAAVVAMGLTYFALMSAGWNRLALGQERPAQAPEGPPQQTTPAPPRPGPGMMPPMSLEGKTAGEAFKNIKVLKDAPADELMPTMQFIAASLGVRCDYCHVRGHFERDDKPAKRTARKMIQMELAIDQDNFKGRQVVTCNTCHGGSAKPRSIPVIAENEPPMPTAMHAEAEGTNPLASLPKPDEILAKYIAAMGGEEALAKVTTRFEQGTLFAFGRKLPVEVYEKAPDKRLSITRMPDGGESITAYDGKTGWLAGGPQPGHAMNGGELAAAQLDATLAFPAEIKTLFRAFRPRPPEKVGASEAYVLLGLRPGEPPSELYFDETSGLLLRVVSYEQTALGRLPQQIDFSDYRDVEGVKVPFTWTIARPQSRFAIQVDSVRQNVPIPDSRFDIGEERAVRSGD